MASASVQGLIKGGIVIAILAVAGTLVFYFAFSIKPSSDDQDYLYTVTINTPLGTLEGKHAHGAVSFYGVPYSKQPARFRHGEFPPEPWGHREAFIRETAPICVQHCYGPKGEDDWVPGCPTLSEGGQSEQCAYMQIAVPERFALEENAMELEKVPVFVYLHGGAFGFGSGHTPLYDGKPMAAMGDVIYVSVNYRLGIFGFGPFPDEWNGEGKESFGNFGLTDQQNALHFINEYIEYFGGDKTRVTLGGQSAGSESAYLNLLSPGQHQQWFNQAMMMSVPLSLPYLTTQQAKTNMWPHIWDAVDSKTSGVCSPTNRNYDCIYDPDIIDTEELYDAGNEAARHWIDSENLPGSIIRFKELFSLAQTYDPIVDKNIVLDQMVEMSRNKDLLQTDKGIMVGSTGDEGELFVKSVLPSGLEQLDEETYKLIAAGLWKILPNSTIYQDMMGIYPWDLDCERLRPDTFPEGCNAVDAANQAVRDYIFVCPQRLILENSIKNSPDQKPVKESYFWYFDEPMPWLPPEIGGKDSAYGRCEEMACHGADISYVHSDDLVLPNVFVPQSEIDISRKFVAYITNFVRHGDANNNSGRVENVWTQRLSSENLSLPNWKPFNKDNWGYMRFASDIEKEFVEYLDGDRVKVNWPRQSDKLVVDQKIACELWDEMDQYGKV